MLSGAGCVGSVKVVGEVREMMRTMERGIVLELVSLVQGFGMDREGQRDK